jgi:hypothetical protein
MANATTTPVRIRPETKARIEAAKEHRRETLDDVLTRLLDERRESRKETRRAS